MMDTAEVMKRLECAVCMEPMVNFRELDDERDNDHRPVIICTESFHKVCRICRDSFLARKTKKCPFCRGKFINQRLAVDIPYAELLLERYLMALHGGKKDEAANDSPPLRDRKVDDRTVEAAGYTPSTQERIPPQLLELCSRIPPVRTVSIRTVDEMNSLICSHPSALRSMHDHAGFRFARLVEFPNYPHSPDTKTQWIVHPSGLHIYMIDGYVNENLSVALDLRNALGSKFQIEFVPEIDRTVRGIHCTGCAHVPKVRDIIRILLLMGFTQSMCVDFYHEAISPRGGGGLIVDDILAKQFYTYLVMMDFSSSRMTSFLGLQRKAMTEGCYNMPLLPVLGSARLKVTPMQLLKGQMLEWMRMNEVKKQLVMEEGGAPAARPPKRKAKEGEEMEFFYDFDSERFFVIQNMVTDSPAFEMALRQMGWRRARANSHHEAEKHSGRIAHDRNGSAYYLEGTMNIHRFLQFLGIEGGDRERILQEFEMSFV